MPIYFHIHDADWFRDRFLPAMTLCRNRRTFAPCRQLCTEILPAVLEFSGRFQHPDEKPFICSLDDRMPFDLRRWRCLVGELLLFGAVEVPEIPQAMEALCRLCATEQRDPLNTPREHFTPMQQAIFGTRDLCFGSTFHRPEHAGWNDGDDVQRLVDFLHTIETATWNVQTLKEWRPEADDEELREEMEFARASLLNLRDMYRVAAFRRRVVVCERME